MSAEFRELTVGMTWASGQVLLWGHYLAWDQLPWVQMNLSSGSFYCMLFLHYTP